MSATFFASGSDFRKWLEKNHKKEKELLVGFYKVSSGKPSMTWSESVDQALCYGWIDGVRKSIDESSYSIRFTPRKKSSIWSPVNIKKISELQKAGLMTEAGLKIFRERSSAKTTVYSYAKDPASLNPEFIKEFKKNKAGWKYFEELAPSYRKSSINWVMSAKQEETRTKRLAQLIGDSAAGTNQWKNNKYKKT